MLGSGIYAAVSMALSLFVIRIVGAGLGGVFSIAITLSQMLVYISYFEIRTFLVTDSNSKYTFSEYHSSKIFLSVIMIIVCIIYVILKNYDIEKTSIVLLVCFSKMLDGYADIYEACFQKIGRLDLAGKSMAYRTLLFSSFFCVLLCLTKRLTFSLLFADCIAIIGVYIFSVKPMHRINGKLGVSYSFRRIANIIVECFPLFLGVFCWTYILSASRIAIDNNMTNEYQAYYQVIFLPVSVVSLFSGFVFRPLLPYLANDYNKHRYKSFVSTLCKEFLAILVITIVCILGAYLFGIPILSILSGCNLDEYRYILMFLQLAGGLNALAYALYYILTIMRCSGQILTGYGIATIFAYLISEPLVKKDGIYGAAFSFFGVVVLLCILFGTLILYKLFSPKNRLRGMINMK